MYFFFTIHYKSFFNFIILVIFGQYIQLSVQQQQKSQTKYMANYFKIQSEVTCCFPLTFCHKISTSKKYFCREQASPTLFKKSQKKSLSRTNKTNTKQKFTQQKQQDQQKQNPQNLNQQKKIQIYHQYFPRNYYNSPNPNKQINTIQIAKSPKRIIEPSDIIIPINPKYLKLFKQKPLILKKVYSQGLYNSKYFSQQITKENHKITNEENISQRQRKFNFIPQYHPSKQIIMEENFKITHEKSTHQKLQSQCSKTVISVNQSSNQGNFEQNSILSINFRQKGVIKNLV